MDEVAGHLGNEPGIALIAVLISLITFVVTIWLDLLTREREARIERRDNRVEKSTAYLELEVHSSEAFRFAADNSSAMKPYESTEPPNPRPSVECKASETTRQYYYQCLNLFEVCSNFRRKEVVDPTVYASWVAWFLEVLDQWYFRELWSAEMRVNYTPDVRHIFDVGVRIYDEYGDEEERRRQFYDAVSHLLGGCDIIRNWLKNLDETPLWPAARHGALKPTGHQVMDRPASAVARSEVVEPVLCYRWNDPADIADAASFGGRVIADAPEYISHGEIQTGLSPDGKQWAPDLGELYAEDFANPDDQDMLVGRDAEGKVRAILVVAWEETPRLRFAVIEDMAVDPAMRSSGIGSELMRLAEERIAERGIDWVFLESGLHNEHAHRFFERHGFETVSHVFARRLG